MILSIYTYKDFILLHESSIVVITIAFMKYKDRIDVSKLPREVILPVNYIVCNLVFFFSLYEINLQKNQF